MEAYNLQSGQRPMNTLSPWDLEAITGSVLRVAARHPGRLVALRFQLPPETDVAAFERQVEDNLADVGIDFVDIYTVPVRGPLRLVAAEFEPW